MDPMDASMSYEGILDDEALAPLKRNHACFQCKKRKVKCDAIRPTCSPCLRSHAHALRSAGRNKTTPPPLVCSWAENDTPETSPPPGLADMSIRSDGSGPTSHSHDGAPRGGADGARKKSVAGKKADKNLEREKDRRKDEEKDQLLARIAELEARLAGLTPATSNDSASDRPSTRTKSSVDQLFSLGEPLWLPTESTSITLPTGAAFSTFGPAIDISSSSADLKMNAGVQPANEADFDFGSFFMIPLNWPRNLPAPFLLEHLIETFFNCAPQVSRMFHRPSLMTRIKLPPAHADFPHASVLHAICAVASTHTAWVNSLPPEALEDAIKRQILIGNTLESIEDFGLSQLEAARRSIHESTNICAMGPGRMMFEVLQANVLMSDVYLAKGLPLQGWMAAGQPARLIKSLELANRRYANTHKEPMFPSPQTSLEREERLATVWQSFIIDSCFSINSYWAQSMDLDDMHCHLPTSAEEFRKNDDMVANPQSPKDPDIYTVHPVADSFILVCKAAILQSRAAKWLLRWSQREPVPGDEYDGPRQPDFLAIVNDILAFQSSMPGVLKNVFRLMDSSGTTPAFDANLMMVHVIPNIALGLLYEPFMKWDSPSCPCVVTVQRAYEAVIGVLHLIPSNLDISLVMTPLLSFSLYTVGRMITDYVQHALSTQNFGLAVRYRADLMTIQNLMDRYAQRNALGMHMKNFLEQYLKMNGPPGANKETRACGMIESGRSVDKEMLDAVDIAVIGMQTFDVTNPQGPSGFGPTLSAGATPAGTSASGSGSGSGLSPFLDTSSNNTPESLIFGNGSGSGTGSGMAGATAQENRVGPGVAHNTGPGEFWSHGKHFTTEVLMQAAQPAADLDADMMASRMDDIGWTQWQGNMTG
ncbi:hypothetical protein JCM24511_03237 [Saitozyma sp. JCM 24511]|nr:hypothetical protein JCM24511_03237 [Saitozyma sp. JCM 24511]